MMPKVWPYSCFVKGLLDEQREVNALMVLKNELIVCLIHSDTYGLSVMLD